VRDAALLLSCIAGKDPMDATSLDTPRRDYAERLEEGVAGLRVGVVREAFGEGVEPGVRASVRSAIDRLSDLGASLGEVSLPHTDYALSAYYLIAPSEASSNLARYDGVRYGLRVDGSDSVDMMTRTRGAGFGAEVKRRVMIGTYVLSAGYYDAYYLRAQKVRTLIKRDFETAFADGIDAVLTPATPSSAFAIGELAEADPVRMYLNDVFTVTVNLAGLPGVSVPAGLDTGGLPLGLQVIGRPWEEGAMLDVAFALERASGFAAKPAKWW
jgi:aspartyl-tRNA(Asn)/glutamyl-tRNA(Gln) amidotransferase subunit A